MEYILFVCVNCFPLFTRYDSGKVDITDLTWEQKERILRYLFARMNGGSSEEKKKMSSAPTLPAIEQGKHRNMTQSQDDLQYVSFYNYVCFQLLIKLYGIVTAVWLLTFFFIFFYEAMIQALEFKPFPTMAIKKLENSHNTSLLMSIQVSAIKINIKSC